MRPPPSFPSTPDPSQNKVDGGAENKVRGN
jgi:hypothetical protein